MYALRKFPIVTQKTNVAKVEFDNKVFEEVCSEVRVLLLSNLGVRITLLVEII